MRDAVAEYEKRLTRYVKLDVVEVADEKTPDGASEKEEERIREKEGERLLRQIKEDDHVVALAISGKQYDSLAFARRLDGFALRGRSRVVFVIGG